MILANTLTTEQLSGRFYS